jgi:hypothetical protein
MVLKDRHVFLR